MGELPKGWVQVILEDVAEVNPRKSIFLEPDDTVTFVPMAAVSKVSGTIVDSVPRPLYEVNRGFTQFADGDVIFAKITPSMENGKSAVAIGLENGIGFGSTEFHVFRSYGTVLPEYLWRFVRQSSFREDARKVMSGAVGQQRVSADYLKAYQLLLPPIEEQNRIVVKINSLIERTAGAQTYLDRIPTLVANYKKRLLEQASSGELTSKWRSGDPSQVWKTVTVESVAKLTFDGPFGSNLKSTDYSEAGIRVVRLENIGSLQFIREKETYISQKKFETLQRHKLLPNDVLFSSFVTEKVRVCLLPADLPTAAINKADCFCVRLDPSICLPKYLAYRLACPSTYKTLKEEVHGATRPRINLTHLRSFQFELPSLAEQKEIIQRIEIAFDWLDRIFADYTAASNMLPKLNAAILSDAFIGKLVPQEPNDEPAFRLLERIRAKKDAMLTKIKHEQKIPHSRKKNKRKSPMTDLIEVLRSKDGWMSASDVAKKLGIGSGSTTDEVEKFYGDLREHVLDGDIEIERRGDDDWLQLQSTKET